MIIIFPANCAAYTFKFAYIRVAILIKQENLNNAFQSYSKSYAFPNENWKKKNVFLNELILDIKKKIFFFYSTHIVECQLIRCRRKIFSAIILFALSFSLP